MMKQHFNIFEVNSQESTTASSDTVIISSFCAQIHAVFDALFQFILHVNWMDPCTVITSQLDGSMYCNYISTGWIHVL